jgi:DNA modification methylase
MPVLLNMDCREGMRTLEAGSVHCVATSPPYYGLRAYHGLGDDQLGHEKSPEDYVANLVAIFREVRRVLRDDGVCWINLGDSYTSGNRPIYRAGISGNKGHRVQDDMARPSVPAGRKPKDLIGIPWLVAFALQADGWWLRSDIIWSKPNPMPESVTDRPTKAHEYVFLLSKSERYWYDQEAVREKAVAQNHHDYTGTGYRAPGQSPHKGNRKQDGHGRRHAGFNARWDAAEANGTAPVGRNLRSVWTISTEPFSSKKLDVDSDHYAIFPQALVRPMLLAGCPERTCPTCGAGWVRVVERGEADCEWQARCGADSSGGYSGRATKDYASARAQDPSATKARILAGMRKRHTVGHRPTCSCSDNDGSLPGLVLDPFAGRGTTLKVAWALGRRSVGFELSAAYHELALKWLHGPLWVPEEQERTCPPCPT